MEKVQLEHGIYVYKNVLPDSLSVIEELEDAVSKNFTQWIPSMVKTGDDVSADTMIRDTDAIGVPYLGRVVEEEFVNISDALYKTLNNIFFEAFDPCEQDYKNSFGIGSEWHDGWSILKYGKGQFFKNHIDDNIAYHRRISTVYYMNDDYEGGEICFPRYDLKIKPEKHDLLIFPSFYTYNHEVLPVTSGTRYAVVGWIK
jgi:predicted 2-oxoglutarate/Fe(II)-dependent dioxygenase YbiX